MQASQTSRRVRWRRHALVALLAVWITALHLPYLAPGGPFIASPQPAPMLHDEGTVLYDSYRTARGETMYRDFFEFQGPVVFYTVGAVFRFTGASMVAGRAVFLLVATASALLIAAIVTRWLGPAAAVAAATIHATAVIPNWPATYGYWFAEPFVLGALALLTRRQPPARRIDLAAGALLGLAILTIHSVAIPALVAVCGVAAADGLARRDRRAALLRPLHLLGGAAAVLIVVSLYFAARGALGEMRYQMIEWVFSNYLPNQGGSDVFGAGIEKIFAAHRGEPWPARALNAAVAGSSLAFAYLVIPVAVVMAWMALTRLVRGGAGVERAYCAGVGLATLTPLYLGLARRDMMHVAFVGGFTLCALLSAASLSRRPLLRRAVATVTLVVALLAGTNYVYKLLTTAEASRAKGSFRDQVFQKPEARLIDERLPPDATIVAPSGYWYLFVRPSALPITLLYEYYTEAQYASLAEHIVRNKPAAIHVSAEWWRIFLARRPEIEQEYVRHGDSLWLRRM